VKRIARPEDPERWAAALGISRAAVDLYIDSEVIDLHLDTFIWQRVFGYDLGKRHGKGIWGGRFYGNADLPRASDALSGATWVITTQPFRSAAGRRAAFLRNLAELASTLDCQPGVRRVGTLNEYRAARAEGDHAAFIGVQGGNAFDAALGELATLSARDLLRVTLLHSTASGLGAPSHAPRDRGLTHHGRRLVEVLNAQRTFVDLAHIAPRGFWDALDVHDRQLPPIVSHSGASGVRPLWRNVDDAQLRAIADRGGVVGVIVHGFYLGGSWWSGGEVERVVDHIAHVVRVAGEDTAALGTDFDGFIIPPRELRSVEELPRLVEIMLQRGFSEALIRKVLGENFLACLGRLRG